MLGRKFREAFILDQLQMSRTFQHSAFQNFAVIPMNMFHYSAVSWMRDEYPLPSPERIVDEYSQKFVSTIDYINVNHSGDYECVAKSSDELTARNRIVTIKVAVDANALGDYLFRFGTLIYANCLCCLTVGACVPQASGNLRMLQVNEVIAPHTDENMEEFEHIANYGERTELVCPIVGTPDPVYRWLRNGIPYIGNATLARTVEFSRVIAEDKGVYTCIAKNRAGSQKFTIYLKVRIFRIQLL